MKALYLFAAVYQIASAGPLGYAANANGVRCPPGYELTGKLCERPEYHPAHISCPVGTLEGDTCVAYAPLQQVCPIGSTESGKECTVIQSLAPDRHCPPGYTDEGSDTCTQRTPLPLVEECEIGHNDGTGQCVQVEIADKVVKTFCPPGYFDEGKGCMKVIDYDCSPLVLGKESQPPPPLPSLPIPIKKHGGHKYGGYGGYGNGFRRMLGARKYNIYAPPVLPLPPPSKGAAITTIPAPSPPAPPPSQVQVVRQGCQRKDFIAPVVESFCPEGFFDVHGAKCHRVTHYPLVKKCANGASAASCYDLKQAQKRAHCDKGVLVGDQCQYRQPVPREVACPAGTRPSGSECIQTTTPLVHCPPGTNLDATTRQCVGVSTAEPQGMVTVPCTGKGCFGH